jgi:hypothetical protein
MTMRLRHPRLVRTASALLGTGLLCLTGGPGMASAEALAPNQCAVSMQWPVSERAPMEGNPYSGYTGLLMRSTEKAALGDVAMVINERFPAAGYGGWFLYPKTYEQPTGGLTFPNIVPNPGSVNPYTPGTRIFAPKRSFKILLTGDAVAQSDLPASLAGIANRVTWPQAADSFTLMQRSYGAKTGYDVGGTGGPLNIPWADVRTYDIKTGKPANCANVEPARDVLQRLSPYNTVGFTGIDRLPRSVGAVFPGRRPGPETYTPKPNPDLVEFFRVPSNGTGLPGGVVPPPAPDTCANYISAKLNQREIAVIRIPKVPSFQPTDPTANATYKQTDAGYYVWQVLGRARQDFRPHSPFNFTLGAEDIKLDSTGGATFVVWPRSMGLAQRAAVFALAAARGWNLLEGNAQSPQYSNSIWLRVNGPASTYTGGTYPTASRSGVPCVSGPQSVLDAWPSTSSLTALPINTGWNTLGSEWAAVPSMMGTATPQGVQCSFRSYVADSCLRRLKQHMKSTGGSYTAN